MKKIVFIGNRQSGKTTMATYEFLKDPENTIFICKNFKTKNLILNSSEIEYSCSKNILVDFPDGFARGINAERLVWDDYLCFGHEERRLIKSSLNNSGLKEVMCFCTPQRLYDKSIFDLVVDFKKGKKIMSFSENIGFTDVLIEMTDHTTRTSEKTKNELLDLYFNYMTDSDTKIIHDRFFFNKKIMKLENVSYFPDEYKELTELKGEFFSKQ